MTQTPPTMAHNRVSKWKNDLSISSFVTNIGDKSYKFRRLLLQLQWTLLPIKLLRIPSCFLKAYLNTVI